MLTDEEIFEALQEEAAELPPELPGGLTEEAAIVAQSTDPVDYTEMDWHIINPPPRNAKPDNECELGSCEDEPSHYCEMLSGSLFFGCKKHVNKLLKMQVAKRKKE